MVQSERFDRLLGTRAAIAEIPRLVVAKPLTHIEALELDQLPEHLIVLGGGYVALEFAQAHRRFGSHVTIVEHGPQLVGREEHDNAACLSSAPAQWPTG